jgi:hypothetical protein
MKLQSFPQNLHTWFTNTIGTSLSYFYILLHKSWTSSPLSFRAQSLFYAEVGLLLRHMRVQLKLLCMLLQPKAIFVHPFICLEHILLTQKVRHFEDFRQGRYPTQPLIIVRSNKVLSCYLSSMIIHYHLLPSHLINQHGPFHVIACYYWYVDCNLACSSPLHLVHRCQALALASSSHGLSHLSLWLVLHTRNLIHRSP